MGCIIEIVDSVNIDANPSGISMQIMDSSHVSLVELQLNWVEFQKYRCDRPVTFGIYLESLSKILKFASNDDIITISAEEDDESLLFQFENPGIEFSPFFSNFPP